MSAAILLAIGCNIAIAQETEAPVTDVDFVRDIKPIFENHCISCHGPDKEENFRIDKMDATMGFVEPGDAEFSQLYEVLVSTDEEELMPPPDEKNPLSPNQISLVKTWIESGANWPSTVSFVVPTKSDPVAQEQGKDGPPAADGVTTPVPPAGKPQKSIGERIWLAIGPLHPAAVHLPIGLLLGAGLFALLGLRGNFVMSDCAYYCLWLGALSSVVAAAFGWSYAIHEHLDADFRNLFDTSEKIFLHRISGIGVSLFAILLSLYASAARAADPDDGLMWKLGAIALAIAVGFVGHTGGELTYGKNHYKEIYEIVDEYTGWGASDAEENGAGGNKAFETRPPDKDDNAANPTGQTSSESGNTESNKSSESTDGDQSGDGGVVNETV